MKVLKVQKFTAIIVTTSLKKERLSIQEEHVENGCKKGRCVCQDQFNIYIPYPPPPHPTPPHLRRQNDTQECLQIQTYSLDHCSPVS
jgi:hypothetical protein